MRVLLILPALLSAVHPVKISSASYNIIHEPAHRYIDPFLPAPKQSFAHRYPQSLAHTSSTEEFVHRTYIPAPKPQPYVQYDLSTTVYKSSANPIQCATGPSHCDHSMYRSFDGSCNNLQHPALGIARSRYSRLLSPKYGDGEHSPPVSVTGEDLPNARLVSLVAFGDADIPDPEYTLVNMQWGQIMTHDMSMQAGGTQAKKHPTSCCTEEGEFIPKESAHQTCYPIIVPQLDPAHSQTGRKCMEFVRTLTDKDVDCPGTSDFYAAEQLTVVSHYMDLSLVYDNSFERNRRLRTLEGGKMISDERHHQEWLPQTTNSTADCDAQDPHEICYLAGDARVNQNPGLTMLQTILLREHNRIAHVLSQINPHWDDERLFQEARKINIAEYVHISYYEWLPIFLGTENMLKNRLIYRTQKEEFVNDYDPSIDPSTINSHATAAFRYFHTQIEGRLDLVTEHRTVHGALRLSDWFNRPGILEVEDNFPDLCRGHATQPEELTDINFDREIKHFLFRNSMPFGGDLRAIDIQRNRDHGLASYNDFREFCGLKRAKSWEDYLDFIPAKGVDHLRSLYADHEDVDLTVGGSLEVHVQGALAGPTFLCILTEQFYRTRVGDRFFYERGDKEVGFTGEQLSEIRKASMARLNCDNVHEIKSIQPRAFHLISKSNPVVPCSSIPEVDLSKWKEGGGGPKEQYDRHFYYSDDYKK